MPRPKRDAHLFEFAKRGAEVRLRELVDEAKNLVGLFPHLRDSFDKDELPLRFIVARDSGAVTKHSGVNRRRRMSAATRKAVSERMRRYWAAKKGTATTPVEAADTKTTSVPAAPKRTMSAEARARISAAQKKRWAKTRRGKKRERTITGRS